MPRQENEIINDKENENEKKEQEELQELIDAQGPVGPRSFYANEAPDRFHYAPKKPGEKRKPMTMEELLTVYDSNGNVVDDSAYKNYLLAVDVDDKLKKASTYGFWQKTFDFRTKQQREFDEVRQVHAQLSEDPVKTNEENQLKKEQKERRGFWGRLFDFRTDSKKKMDDIKETKRVWLDENNNQIQELLWFKRWAEYKLERKNEEIYVSNEAMEEAKEEIRNAFGENGKLDIEAGEKKKRSRDDSDIDKKPEFDSDMSLADYLKHRKSATKSNKLIDDFLKTGNKEHLYKENGENDPDKKLLPIVRRYIQTKTRFRLKDASKKGKKEFDELNLAVLFMDNLFKPGKSSSKTLFFAGVRMLGEAIEAIKAVRIDVPGGNGQAAAQTGFFDNEPEALKAFTQLENIYECMKALNDEPKLAKFITEIYEEGAGEIFPTKADQEIWEKAFAKGRGDGADPEISDALKIRFGRIMARYIVNKRKDPEVAAFKSWSGNEAINKSREEQLHDILLEKQKASDLFEYISWLYLEDMQVQKEGEKSGLGSLISALNDLRDIDKLALYLEKLPEDKLKPLFSEEEDYNAWKKVLDDEKADKESQGDQYNRDENKATQRQKDFFAGKELVFDKILEAYLKDNGTAPDRIYYKKIIGKRKKEDYQERLRDFIKTGDIKPLQIRTTYFDVKPSIHPKVRDILTADSRFEFNDQKKKSSPEIVKLNLSIYALDTFLTRNEPTGIERFKKAALDLKNDLKAVEESNILEGEDRAQTTFQTISSLVGHIEKIANPVPLFNYLVSMGEDKAASFLGNDEDFAKWKAAFKEERKPRQRNEGEEEAGGENEFEVVRKPPTSLPDGLSFKFGSFLSLYVGEMGTGNEFEAVVKWTGNTAGRPAAFKARVKELFNAGEMPYISFMDKVNSLVAAKAELNGAADDEAALIDVISPLAEENGGKLYQFFDTLQDDVLSSLLVVRDAAEDNFGEWRTLKEDPTSDKIMEYFGFRPLNYGAILRAYIDRNANEASKEFYRKLAGDGTKEEARQKLDDFIKYGDEDSLSDIYHEEVNARGEGSFVIMPLVSEILMEESRVLWQNPEKARSREAAELNLALRLADDIFKKNDYRNLDSYSLCVDMLSNAVSGIRSKDGFLDGEDAALSLIEGFEKLLPRLRELKNFDTILDFIKTLDADRVADVVPRGKNGVEYWEFVRGGLVDIDWEHEQREEGRVKIRPVEVKPENMRLKFAPLVSFYVNTKGSNDEALAYKTNAWNSAGEVLRAENSFKELLSVEPMKLTDFVARFDEIIGQLDDDPADSEKLKPILTEVKDRLFADTKGDKINQYILTLGNAEWEQIFSVAGGLDALRDWGRRNTLPKNGEDANLSGTEFFFKNYELDYGRIVHFFLTNSAPEAIKDSYRKLQREGGYSSLSMKLGQFRSTGEDSQLFETVGEGEQKKEVLSEGARAYLQKKSRLNISSEEKAASGEMGLLNLRVMEIDYILKGNEPVSFQRFKKAVVEFTSALNQCRSKGVFALDADKALGEELENYASSLLPITIDDTFYGFINSLSEDYAASIFASDNDRVLWGQEYYARLAGGAEQQEPDAQGGQRHIPENREIPEQINFKFGSILARFIAEKGNDKEYAAYSAQTGNQNEKGTFVRRRFKEFLSAGTNKLRDFVGQFLKVKTDVNSMEGDEWAKEKALVALIDPICNDVNGKKLAIFLRKLHPNLRDQLIPENASKEAYKDILNDMTEEDLLSDEVNLPEFFFVSLNRLDFGKLLTEYIERKGNEANKGFIRELTGRAGSQTPDADLNAFIERGEGEDKLYFGEGDARTLLPAIAELLRDYNPFELDEETMRTPQMAELNLAVRLYNEIIKNNEPQKLSRFKSAAQRLQDALEKCVEGNLFKGEDGREASNKLYTLLDPMLSLSGANELLTFLNSLPEDKLPQMFENDAALNSYLGRGENVPQNAPAQRQLSDDMRFKFGNVLAAYTAEKYGSESNDIFIDWTGNKSGQPVFATRFFKETIGIGQASYLQVSQKLSQLESKLDELDLEFGDYRDLLSLIKQCFGQGNSDQLIIFFRGLHKKTQEELCSSPADYTAWKDSDEHPNNVDGIPTDWERAFFNEKKMDYSGLISAYVERNGDNIHKAIFRNLQNTQTAGNAAALLNEYLDEGGREKEEALFKKDERGNLTTLLPGIAEIFIDVDESRFDFDEELMRRSEVAELNLRARVMDRHLKENGSVSLARLSEDARNLNDAINVAKLGADLEHLAGNEQLMATFEQLQNLMEQIINMISQNKLPEVLKKTEPAFLNGVFADVAKDKLIWYNALAQADLNRQDINAMQMPQNISFKAGNLVALFLASSGTAEQNAFFTEWTRNSYGRAVFQNRLTKESSAKLKELLKEKSIKYDAFEERLKAIRNDLNSVDEGIKDTKTIEVIDSLSIMLDGAEDDAFGRLTGFIINLSEQRRRELLGAKFNDWNDIEHEPWGDEGRRTSGDEVLFFDEAELDYPRIVGAYIEQNGSQQDKERYRSYMGYEEAGTAQGKIDAAIADMKPETYNALFRKDGEGENAPVVMLSGVMDILKQDNPFASLVDEDARNSTEVLNLAMAMRLCDELIKNNRPSTFNTFVYVTEQLSGAIMQVLEKGYFDLAEPLPANSPQKEAFDNFARIRSIADVMVNLLNPKAIIRFLSSLRKTQRLLSFGSPQDVNLYRDAESTAHNQRREMDSIPENIRFDFSALIGFYITKNKETDDFYKYTKYLRNGGNQAHGLKALQFRKEEKLKDFLMKGPMKFGEFNTQLRSLFGVNQNGELRSGPAAEKGAAQGAKEIYDTLKEMAGGAVENDPGNLARLLERLTPETRRTVLGEELFNEWEAIHHRQEADENQLEEENANAENANTEQKVARFFLRRSLDFRKLFYYYLLWKIDQDYVFEYYFSLGVRPEM